MENILPIIASVFLVSLASLVGVFMLAIHDRVLKKMLLFLVSFSTGALLGNVFAHLLPEIIEHANGDQRSALMFVLSGILASYVIEQFIHWRHCHTIECEGHVHPAGPLVIIGDAAHNVVDGVLIATSYLVSVPIGIATTIAVMLHEIPQEVGDFAILVHSGYSKEKALVLNFLSALAAFLGVGAVLLLTGIYSGIESYLLPLAAGNFLYIAGSDLIPELHKEVRPGKALLQLVCMLAGVVLMFSISNHTESGDGHNVIENQFDAPSGEQV